jgi:hydrogenase expression/formation protein HypD
MVTARPNIFDPKAFRNPQAARALLHQIELMVDEPINLMEVCGTHTVEISRSGIRAAVPPELHLLSGPGCPVCVTPLEEIDRAIAISTIPDVILTTFGDMLSVPGSHSTLEKARASGGDVRIVYSPLDALKIARTNPSHAVVFLGVGFETTSPTVAATLAQADREGVNNFSVLAAFKLIPPAMQALLSTDQVRIDGFICPGHVSTIIGSEAYHPLATAFHVPCVVAGFEPLDILQSILMLLVQRKEKRADVEIQYRRSVRPEGNPTAKNLLQELFSVEDTRWRAMGTIPESGLALRPEYERMDALTLFPMEIAPAMEPPGCICGHIMRGLAIPTDCSQFGTTCTPADPIGPCMVSSEGACAAYFKYGGGRTP